MTQPTPEEIALDVMAQIVTPEWGNSAKWQVIADAIRKEREEAEKRGWNAATAACAEKVEATPIKTPYGGVVIAHDLADAIRALEKP